MGRRVVVESRRDRRALVADAGWSQLSLASVLAGILVAYGAFALLAGIAGGLLDATGADTDITARWDDLGVVAGLVVAALLFLSYLFGGYVAGRMARRAGLLHGLAVFVLGVVVLASVAVAIRALAGADSVVENLRELGLPTTGDEWAEVGTIAGLASLAAALVGGVLGGMLGERWHAKLLARAIDPDVGAEAEARRAAELAANEARVRHDESRDRVDTASLRGLRETTGSQPNRRPLATTERPNGSDEVRSGWYRDRNLDDVPDRRSDDPVGGRRTAEGGPPAGDPRKN
ncbi:MAG: TIGR04086 family membrane protein [Actinomycetota bacterium]|nr:TIGR04086 family membrane protein [Actinomycetota bacterium]